jgi:outer membrane protein assembly factor BamB
MFRVSGMVPNPVGRTIGAAAGALAFAWLGVFSSMAVAGCSVSTSGERPLHAGQPDAAARLVQLGMVRGLTDPFRSDLRPDEYGGVAADPRRGLLYAGTDDGRLLALDHEDGMVRWEYELAGGLGGLPHVADDLLLVGTDDGALVAIDLNSHEEAWRYETTGVIRRPPVLAGGVVYFANSRDQVFALDARNGAWRWQYERAFQKEFTIFGRSGLSFVPNDDPDADEVGVLYSGFDDGRVVAIGATSGEALWIRNLAPKVEQGFADVDSTPLVDAPRGEVVVAAQSTGIHGLSLDDGSIKWVKPVKGAGTLVATGDGGYVFASSLEGLFAIEPGGRTRWRVEVDPGRMSTPMIIDGVIYLTHSEVGLMAYDLATGEHLARFDPGSGMSAPPSFDPSTQRLFTVSNRGVLVGLWLESGRSG